MTTTKASWDMSGMIVLLPWGPGHDADDGGGDVRCGIEQMDGAVAYAKPPRPPYGQYGENPANATHEYVPDGAAPTTVLPVVTPADVKARLAAAHREYAAFLAQFARPAHVPVMAAAATPGQESRYFGQPWMPTGMEWPTLDGTPMNFVLQLDLSALPAPQEALGGQQGLLLFFHAEEYDEEKQSLVVVVDPDLPGGLRATPEGAHENPPLAIASWRAVTDYPWGDTRAAMEGHDRFESIALGFGSCTIGVVECEDGKERHEAEAVARGLSGVGHCFECDKLGGWPRWEQGDETPEDSAGTPMRYLMQIGYEGLLLDGTDVAAIYWPTWGRGHIFVSPATGEFKYVWACD